MKLVRLQQMWRHFNETYFDRQLHEIPIKLTRGKKYYGKFIDRPLPQILLSGVRNKEEYEWKDSLLHEMIHQYLWEQELEHELDHGPLFMDMALKLGVKVDHEYI